MGALYDRLKNKVATTTTGNQTGGLYERLKNKQSQPQTKQPTSFETVSSFSAIAPKNYGLGEFPKPQFGVPTSSVMTTGPGATAETTKKTTTKVYGQR